MATRKRRAEIASAGSTPDDIDLTSAPVPADPDEHICKIPDSQRLFISLTGKSFERALLSKLDWLSYLYVPKPPDPCIWINAHRTSLITKPTLSIGPTQASRILLTASSFSLFYKSH